MSDQIQARNKAVLEAALTLATDLGWRAVTRDAVAVAAGVSQGSVNNAFGTIENLRDRVMQEAISREIVSIVAAGIAARHVAAIVAPDDLKKRALALLAA